MTPHLTKLPIYAAFIVSMAISSPSFSVDISSLKNLNVRNQNLTGKIESNLLNEASGITRSGYSNDIFWLINDGGDEPFIYAVNRQGKDLGRYYINGIDNRDWEDISSFTLDGQNYLIIADTGDNDSIHKHSFLYIIKEPIRTDNNSNKLTRLKLSWRIRFQYQNGPRDCESIAVDTANNRILLLSKRTVPAVMYELPLKPNKKRRLLKAIPIAKLSNIPQPEFFFILTNPIWGQYASQPTAMDISLDGMELAVLTYKFGYIYQRNDEQSWEQALMTPPKVFYLPKLTQAEALSFDINNDIFITSEKTHAPLYLIKRSNKPIKQ